MTLPQKQVQIEALREIGAQFHQLEEAGEGRARQADAPRRVAFAVGLALVLGVFLAFTPPGQSVASAVGDLVGIGDDAPAPPGERAVYIDAGEGPGEERYEVTATTNHGETCFTVAFPDVKDAISSGRCLTGPGPRAELEEQSVIPSVDAAPATFDPDSGLVLRGLLAPSVEDVTVEYVVPGEEPAEASIYFSKLDEELSAQIRSQDEAGFFLTFLPVGILTGTAEDPKLLTEKCVAHSFERVTIRTFGADGSTIAEVNLGDVASHADGVTGIPPPGFDSNAKVPLPGETPGGNSFDPEETPPVPYDPTAGGACGE